MADVKGKANYKRLEKTKMGMRLLFQGGVFLFLLNGLLISATPVPKDLRPSRENHNSYSTIVSFLRDISTEMSEEPDDLKMLRIHLVLKNFRTGLSPNMERQLANFIYRESLEYNYDPELILALIMTESSFYNWSKSSAGAIGLMQILPATGRAMAKAKNIPWNGKKTLFNPNLNIKLGTHYLALLHDRFGDLETALTAYNYGPSRVAEMQKRCDRLPQAYASRIMNAYKRFLELNHTELDPVMSS